MQDWTPIFRMTEEQARLARQIESARIASYNRIEQAFEAGEWWQIDQWERTLLAMQLHEEPVGLGI